MVITVPSEWAVILGEYWHCSEAMPEANEPALLAYTS